MSAELHPNLSQMPNITTPEATSACPRWLQRNELARAFHSLETGLFGKAFKPQLGHRRWSDNAADRPAESRGRHRKEHAGHQGDRGKDTEAGCHECPARHAARADMDLVRGGGEMFAGCGSTAVGFAEAVNDLFDDVVLGPHDDRAEGLKVGVGDALVVPGDAEEARGPERLGPRQTSLRCRRNDSSRVSMQ